MTIIDAHPAATVVPAPGALPPLPQNVDAERAPAALLAQLIDAPVLVLDDLGRANLTVFALAALYRLLDERLRRHTPETPHITFVTANDTFAALYALDAALASRLAAHTAVTLCVASDYRLHAAREGRPQ